MARKSGPLSVSFTSITQKVPTPNTRGPPADDAAPPIGFGGGNGGQSESDPPILPTSAPIGADERSASCAPVKPPPGPHVSTPHCQRPLASDFRRTLHGPATYSIASVHSVSPRACT